MDNQNQKFYEALADSYRFLPGEDEAELNRVAFVKYLLRGTTNVRTALDVGCGEGYLCSLYRQWGIDVVVGADSALKRITYGKIHFPSVHFLQCGIVDCSISSKSFDLVSAVEVLEHIDDVEHCIMEMARISNKYVVITVPNEGRIIHTVCPQCLHRFEPAGHLHSFSIKTLETLCSKHLNVLKVTDNFWINRPHFKNIFLPLMKRIRSGRNLMGNYIGLIGLVK